MTPDELRSLADAAERRDSDGDVIWDLAPDLARLCAELGEAIDAADSRKHAFEYGERATAWRALRKTRAKLSELKPVT